MKSVPFGLALLLVCPASAPAQTTFSLAGGLNVATTVPTELPIFHGSTTRGFAVQASVSRPYHNRFAWRIDAFVSQFELTLPSGFAGVLCQHNPPPGTCCGICPLRTDKGPVAVTGVAVNQLVNVTPAAFPFGMYLIWGAETDYLYQHPIARGALRLRIARRRTDAPFGGSRPRLRRSALPLPLRRPQRADVARARHDRCADVGIPSRFS